LSYGWGDLVLRLRARGDLTALSDADLAEMFAEYGLPQTPGTVRHLRAVVAGIADPPAPTRGLLVTTRVRTLPPHDVSITGQLDTTTNDILEKVVPPIVLRHRDFATNVVGQIREANVRQATQAVQRRSRPALELEYENAAWEERKYLRDPNRDRSNGIEGMITDYLNEIDKRVRRRRERAGLVTTAPDGWRDRVRPRLQEFLMTQIHV
jgi:hypothetical protein